MNRRDWTTTYSYDGSGNIYSITYKNGSSLTFDHVSSSKLKIAHSGGQSVELALGANGRVTSVRDPSGNTWKYEYTQSGMLSKVTSPGTDPDIREYHYEDTVAVGANTLLTGISINGKRYSRYQYYQDGRVKQSALEGGEEVDNFVYGFNLTTLTDARGQATLYSHMLVNNDRKVVAVSRSETANCSAAAAQTYHDANGYVSSEVDWEGKRTEYQYSSKGELLSVTVAAGTADAYTRRYTWEYDRMTKVESIGSDGQVFAREDYQYHYSNYVSQKTTTDLQTGAQRIINYAYQFSNFVLVKTTSSEQLPEGTATWITEYDLTGNVISITNPLQQVQRWSGYNGLGLPASYTDVNGVVTSYTYDPRGNLLTQSIAGRTTTYTYNHDRQVTSISYPNGSVTRYQYNAAGRLEYVNTGAGEPMHMAVDVAGNSVRTSAARHYAEFNGGTPYAVAATEFSSQTVLDTLGRPYTELGNKGQQVEKRYDKNSNLISITDAQGRATLYEYDAANRLTRSMAPDGGVTTLAYDVRGNLESVTDPRMLVTRYTYNGFGQVTSVNSPDAGTITYDYDAAGRLKTETKADGHTIAYTSDLLGRRLTRVSAEVGETFRYDEGANGKGRLTSFNDVVGETRYEYNAYGEITAQKNNFWGNLYTMSTAIEN